MTAVLAGKRIGIIGTGAMGQALGRGLVSAGAAPAEAITVCDIRHDAAEEFARSIGATVAPDNETVVRNSDIILLAVKPHLIAGVIALLREVTTPEKLLISIAAGLHLHVLENCAPAGVPIVRAMPNTGVQIGEGATAYCAGSHATPQHLELAAAIFNAVGTGVEVEERLIDAVTGLSGSGPAYAYLMIEALIDGGVKAGLPRPVARKLAAQTVAGAARMIQQTDLHPGQLKDMVTTPAGTTIAGVAVLEREGVRSALIQAVEAAAARSAELGK